MTVLRRLTVTLEMIKFQHTLFALPFAFTGMILAARGLPRWGTLLWVMLAMVGARSAALTFNRIADRRFDAANPRTAGRALPAGKISLGFAAGFVVVSAGLFVLAAAMLNPLCFALSPVALLVALGYSFTKRFTPLSHFVLGLSLAMAPMGGWLAVTGTFGIQPLLLSFAVLAWTAGFDILYACQDRDFDRRAGLHSIPARWGVRASLRASSLLHSLTVLALVGLIPLADLGWIYLAGMGLIAAFLFYEHSLVSPANLGRLNVAFFQVNAWVSVLIFTVTLFDLLI
ncbi:MAG: 4-hydroxybenzoate octaprenyltransferase [Acidobacteria bacterium]|nr:MAG: 4-hydroxybenzoate octaprenyltransferase [Acidobacteriota bacterium]